VFAAPDSLVARGVKRGAVSISPVPPTETITEGPVDLVNDIVFPLTKDEKKLSPFNCATVNKAASQSCCMHLSLTTSSGVVFQMGNGGWNLRGVSHSVEDGPDDASIFVHKEQTSPASNRPDWWKDTATAKFPDPVIQENWRCSCTSMDNLVATHQTKAGDPVCAVTQFILPFKCLKEIKHADIMPIFDDDGTVNLHFHLWHADQSGRNAVSINEITKIKKQLCFDATRSCCTFATNLPKHFYPPTLTTTPIEST